VTVTEYLHGVHCGEPAADEVHPGWDGNRPGWRLWVKAVGHDPTDASGDDFRLWKGAGFGVIVRLQHGWDGGGCIPIREHLVDFGVRCGRYVQHSPGIDVVVIGNEMNHSQEWQDEVPITPRYYGEVYHDCRQVIHGLAPGVLVAVGAVAPYNHQGDPADWIDYHRECLQWCGEYDAVAVHAYARGQEREAITARTRMDPPFDTRYNGFQVYREFAANVADGVPMLLTEFNPIQTPRGWRDRNTGIICEMYGEIDGWNQAHPRKPFVCALPYRTAFDDWSMADKPQVIEDYEQAVSIGYPSPEVETEDPPMSWNTLLETTMGAFYDYEGVGELTVPTGSVLLYEHNAEDKTKLNRPEFDHKIAPQPEVHTPPMSAAFFGMYSTMQAALVWEIQAPPGSTVRASIWAMGVDGGGDVGQVLGITGTNPGEGAIEPATLDDLAQWGSWWSHNMDEWTEREWRQLWTPVITTTQDRFWVIARGVTNYAQPGHTHWDDLLVQIEGEAPNPPPPPPGEGTIQDHIARIRTEVDALDAFVQSGSRLCLLVE